MISKSVYQHTHYLLYKPYGYLSQFVNNGPKQGKKKLLGELYSFELESMAIGRLDEASEGLLLITTDGKMSELVRGSQVQKEYIAQLDGIITQQSILQLEKGVEIGLNGKKYTTKPCHVKKIDTPNIPARSKKIRDSRHGPTSWVSITLQEGKFRQVRKMTAAVGFPTLRLIRIRIGPYTIGSMQPGEVRQLPKIQIE